MTETTDRIEKQIEVNAPVTRVLVSNETRWDGRVLAVVAEWLYWLPC